MSFGGKLFGAFAGFCAMSAFGLFSLPAQAEPDFQAFEASVPQGASVQGNEQIILTVTGDALRPGAWYHFLISTDAQGDATGLIKTERDVTRQEFSLETVRNPGAVISYNQEHGLEVIRLIGPNLTAKDGGPLKMRYLYSGIDKSYEAFDMEIQRVGSKWVAYTGSGDGLRPITKLYLKKNSFLGKTIGIKQVIAE